MSLYKRFLQDESGAVTVDWVVLTSGIVILAFLAVTPILGPISDMAAYIRDTIIEYHAFLE
jgi:Flp pilus assembly pilin Flp